jgi:hypothetical protein
MSATYTVPSTAIVPLGPVAFAIRACATGAPYRSSQSAARRPSRLTSSASACPSPVMVVCGAKT